MSFSYGLDTFQADASVLDPWASRSACEPFKSRISIQALAPVILWDISPGVFHSQMFWGSSLRCRFQGLLCLIPGANPLPLPLVGHGAPGVGFGEFVSLPPPFISIWPLWCRRACSFGLKVVSRGDCSTCSCRSIVLTGGGAFRGCLHHHPEPHPLSLLFHVCFPY